MAKSSKHVTKIGLMMVTDEATISMSYGFFLLAEKLREKHPEKMEFLPQPGPEQYNQILEDFYKEPDFLIDGMKQMLPQIAESMRVQGRMK